MATPVTATSGSSTAATPVQAKDDSNVNVQAKAKAQLNVSIVQASLTVSLNSSNDPLSVVLKTALTGINEALKDDFGDNAIQNAVSQDNTPEGTASRIVSLSTAFYEAFKQQHPGEEGDAVLNKFMDTLKKGVDQGFKEARGVLDGLKVLNGDVASNIDKTYELVQKGYADFAAAHQAQPAAETDPAPVKAGPGQ
ncbi:MULTISPECIES: DUF5610 domain-containing protein [unclassified Duganella]|uniref:DUF5610 domain-containing protein n=1 Tax=unclassified Duganella TaxID=2636909 RepID=UPI000E348F76|nr:MULTISPECIES: DUF5610 domain-containing protein [unclassified Duganella]RFP08641.1 hypothetical protein D0T23_28410 [Duganella sp. BJB475]RFP27505.1 hypothetical protein D0T21_22345 [Duganella sp. BJB476]